MKNPNLVVFEYLAKDSKITYYSCKCPCCDSTIQLEENEIGHKHITYRSCHHYVDFFTCNGGTNICVFKE